MRVPADLLTTMRLMAAVVMPWAIVRGGSTPVLLWMLAALTDFVDGPVARRWGGESRHGAVLDPVADVAFVLATFVTLAAVGLVAWVVPMAVATSVAAYAAATLRGSRMTGELRVARSQIGHAAGVVNYAASGIVVGAVAWPTSISPALVPIASAGVVLVNVAAVVERSLRGELSRRPT